MAYDLSTLNSEDLENLVCDLLNAEEQTDSGTGKYRTFKVGKDKGIDILKSWENGGRTIVQVKHYYRSGFPKLIDNLRKVERAKVMLLKPERYIFVTSLDLSVNNIEAIRECFDPYTPSLNDILGLSDINRLITAHPEVLRQHFKLWFSGTDVLQNLLSYQMEGRSAEFSEEVLKKKLRLYVKTNTLDKARSLLEENNFLIITGEPGSGKTSMAELLVYEYIKDGFELTYIYDDIKEVETLSWQTNVKQIIYFDDFLGNNAAEIAKARGAESALLKILERISRQKDKRFILTTRTFILNTAVAASERLQRFDLKARESKLHLSSYNQEIRQQMLANHRLESDLPENLKKVLELSGVISFITGHEHFYPRSVEFITQAVNVGDLSPEAYEKFIYENFDLPDKIWKHAYFEQIGIEDRFLLNTMLSLGNSVALLKLKMAFERRLRYEADVNHYPFPMNAFDMAFKRLTEGFIVDDYPNSGNSYRFINPSLVDFLIKLVREDGMEAVRIAESACFISQLTERLYPLDNYLLKLNFSKKLTSRLTDPDQWEIELSDNAKLLTLALLLIRYGDPAVAAGYATGFIEDIDDWSFLIKEDRLQVILQKLLYKIDQPKVINVITSVGLPIFMPVVFNAVDIEEVLDLFTLMSVKFSIDPGTLFYEQGIVDWEEFLNGLLENKATMEVYYIRQETLDAEAEEESLEKLYRHLLDDVRKIKDHGLSLSPDIYARVFGRIG